MGKRDAEFIKVAQARFEELQAEYLALWPTLTPVQFSNLCHNTLGLERPTPFDYLSVASVLVREANEDANYWDRMAEDAEHSRLAESPTLTSARTERDWT